MTRAAALLALIAIPLAFSGSDAVRGGLVSLVAFMRGEGALGVLALFGAQIIAALLAMPIWLMSGVAGYVYGFPAGALFALPGVALSSCVAFSVARALASRSVARALASRAFARSLAARSSEGPLFRAVGRAVREDGLRIMLLLRVTLALPQPVVTYALAWTPVRLRHFALGTLVGLVPSTLLHTYVGSLVESAAALVSGEARARGALGWVTLGAGLAVSAAALFAVSRLTKRALMTALAEATKTGPSERPRSEL